MMNIPRTWTYLPIAIGIILFLPACDGRAVNQLSAPGPVAPVAPLPTYTLSGIVSEETAAGSVPVEGAVVSVSTMNRASTDRGGAYEIRGVPRGMATVSVTAWAYVSNSTAIEISGDTQRDIRLTRLPTFTLFGIAYETTEAGRVPVPGVSVYCDSCGSSYGHTFATTDAEGAYSFDWSMNGSIPLQVSKDGYRLVAGTAKTIVATVNGNTRFDIELVGQ